MRRARRYAALPAAVGCLYRPPNEKSGPETIGRGVRFGVAVLVGSTVAVRNVDLRPFRRQNKLSWKPVIFHGRRAAGMPARIIGEGADVEMNRI